MWMLLITIVFFTNNGAKMDNWVYSYADSKEVCEETLKNVIPKYEKRMTNGTVFGTCVFANEEL